MLTDLERDFDAWWQNTGCEFASAPRIAYSELGEFLRLLCRIAYCQGRIDECIIQETAALKQLSKVSCLDPVCPVCQDLKGR